MRYCITSRLSLGGTGRWTSGTRSGGALEFQVNFLDASKAAFPPTVVISLGALPAGVVPSAVACLLCAFATRVRSHHEFSPQSCGDGMPHSTVVEATKVHTVARSSPVPWKPAELSVRVQVLLLLAERAPTGKTKVRVNTSYSITLTLRWSYSWDRVNRDCLRRREQKPAVTSV